MGPGQRRAGLGCLGVVTLAFLALPAAVEQSRNQVDPGHTVPVSDAARALHARLEVVDLHCDTLLWARDLLERGSRGHVDLPRLREGHVMLQVFAATTKTPRGLNYARNRADAFDMLMPLTFFQRWPPAAWTSPFARALHIAARLDDAAARSGGGLTVIRSAPDLRALRAARAGGRDVVGGLLALEGSHPLGGDLARLDRLYDAGYRMAAPAHFFDNEVGGSAHGEAQGGLTAHGRAWVVRMEEKGMVIDLAHSSARTFDDVIALAHRPLVVSHTGVRATCDTPRNLSDAQLRAVAGTGGVVGIGFWPDVLCGDDARAVARAVRHAVAVAGIDHVGLGSDFDGSVTTPFDAAGLDQVTAALLAAGLSPGDVARVMGGNALRVLETTLPPR